MSSCKNKEKVFAEQYFASYIMSKIMHALKKKKRKEKEYAYKYFVSYVMAIKIQEKRLDKNLVGSYQNQLMIDLVNSRD